MAWLKTRTGTFYDKEILKYPTGLEATKNVVIDSTTVPVDSSSGRFIAQAGTLLISNTGSAGQSAIYTVSVPSGATGGSFQLQAPAAYPGGAGGQGITAPVAYNVSAADLSSALQALPDIGEGNANVTETPGTAGAPNVYTITLGGGLASTPMGPISAVNSTVVGGTGSVTTAQTQAGVAPDASGKVAIAPSSGVTASQVVGILTHTVEFFYPVEPNVTDEPAAAYFWNCIFDLSKLINVSGNLAAVQTALSSCAFQ